jgi:tRNA (guanine37-N1)-methyltransferase
MRFDIITIFPEFFSSPSATAHGIFAEGVVARALRSGIATAHTHDLRNFTHDKHRTVDDRPFGGGEGMVLKPQPIFECAESLNLTPKETRDTTRESVILLSAQGKRFTQATARRLATLERVVFICGRYEGVDERVAQLLCDEELSIGDYVLSGGELAAAVILDATVRLLPGVLGHADSSKYESFGEGDEPTTNASPEPKSAPLLPRSTNAAAGLLDYPHYTRPADFRGAPIPDVLADGDHVKIRKWRREAALAKTHANRPDLLANADLSEADREFLFTLDCHTDRA